MCKKVVFAVLMVSLIGCTDLKQKFGTGVETQELRTARGECRAEAGKAADGKYYNAAVFDTCMKKRGYNRLGKKIK